MELYPEQIEAVRKMHNGCVLAGNVGSGKSITSLAYYFVLHGGRIIPNNLQPMRDPSDLYIITTAKKRDSHDWEGEMIPFLMSTDPEINPYNNKIVVDSWNNIKKYKDVKRAFFIFDEDKITGYGAWAKAFIKIAKNNRWIVLSATPGDNYHDYMSILIANGFYKNKTDFERQHVEFDRFCDFPKIKAYHNTQRLDRLISRILIPMTDRRHTIRHHYPIKCSYNKKLYLDMMRNRWNPWKDEPMQNAAELCYCLRRVVNEDESRQVCVLEIMEKHPKAIIFYNTTPELEILRNLAYPPGTKIAEWNGQIHQPLPDGDMWVYLVQFNCSEGWNAITTDTIIFYSQNYSYKFYEQACGRIDRVNTPYFDLHYYDLISDAAIDRSIRQAITDKKKFNEDRFVKW